jgi:hypothetical protein
VAVLSVLALGLVGLPSASAEAGSADLRTTAARHVSYDAVVRADRPSAYWGMSTPGAGTEKDLANKGNGGRYVGAPARTRLPNGDIAADFDGATQYLQVPDAAGLSPATLGVLTVEAWMRPDTLQFRHAEGSGYVHWMGKGQPGEHEYVARMYSLRNDENRPNRISGYLFDASGGKGAGSYFQGGVQKGEWIHYVLVINTRAKSEKYPNGYTKIYRDGALKAQNDLNYRGTAITPTRGGAPFRVGTRDLSSFFEGAVGKVAIYDKELPAERVAAHHRRMMTGR